ncbi:MAG: hypothetical protein INR71_02475, partial [Terriglobus roseus]|nr:hypothetical protein [Terriglobus roseus]
GTNAGATQGQQAQPNPFAMFAQGGAGQGNPFAALFNPPSTTPGQTPGASPPHTASVGQGTPANPTPSATAQPTPASDGAQANPFASLFGAQGGDQNDNPFARMTQQMMQNPEMMRNAMNMAAGMMGGGGAGGQQAAANPFGLGGAGLSPFGGSPEPPDNRPPEVRYEDQLRQLNDMGFFEFERNVQALRRSGGSVQGAVEYLLSNP